MKQAAMMTCALVLAAGCASAPVGGVSAPTGPSVIPSAALDLGDWRRASAAATLAAFQRNVASRYGAGLSLNAVTADLRRNEFNCRAGQPAADGRGDPAAQICRRTITASACTHTWQVHLFDHQGDARLARTRGLYDRRCGGDGLLGGPGD